MKKLFTMLAVAIVFAACGTGENKDAAADSLRMVDSMRVADSTTAAAAAAAAMDSAKAAMDTAKAAMDSATKK